MKKSLMILTFILPLVAKSQRLGSSDEGWGSGGSSPFGFLYWIGFFILVVILKNIFESKNKKKEDIKKEEKKREEKRKNEEREKRKDREELNRLKKLDEYEETDCYNWDNTFYFNINEVKNQHKNSKEHSSQTFKSKSKEEFERRCSQRFFLDKNLNSVDKFTWSVKQYLIDGTVNIRNSEGVVTCKEFFIAGVKSFSTYYDKNGKEKQDCWQAKYDNGQLSVERFYLNGNKHGVQKSWHENGQLSYECNYTYGIRHGYYRLYKNNGELDFEWQYKNGVKIDE